MNLSPLPVRAFPLSHRVGIRILALTLGLGLTLLAGCTGTSARTAGETLTPEAATAAYTDLIEGQSLDLSLVRTVRLTLDDGEQLDVTSLMPAKITASQDGPEAARSLVAFSPDRNRVIFYTRGEAGGPAHVLERNWADLKTGESFIFPVLTEAGEVVDTRIEVGRLLQKPETQ